MTSVFRLFAVLGGFIAISAGSALAADKPATTAPSKIEDPALENKAAEAQLELRLPPIKFDAVGLNDVVDFLRDVNGANIFVNWKALEGAGIDRQVPVTVNLHNVKFGKALRIILDSLSSEKAKLTFKVDSGVIAISTASELFGEPLSRAYDVKFLLPGGLEPGERDKRVAALLRLVVGSIDPPSWGLHDGRAYAAMELNGSLIVVQTEKNLVAIEGLLKHLPELMKTAKP
jgi:hypothetical protein